LIHIKLTTTHGVNSQNNA